MTEHLQESRVFILANGGERKNPGSSIKNVEDDRRGRMSRTSVGNVREGKTGMTEGGEGRELSANEGSSLC